LQAIYFVFTNSFSKSIFNEKAKVKITAAEVTGSRKIIPIPRIRLCPSDPTIPFKLCRRRFPIKIAFAVPINKAQGQTLKPSPVFPMASSM
jgi:hypothetical protein